MGFISFKKKIYIFFFFKIEQVKGSGSFRTAALKAYIVNIKFPNYFRVDNEVRCSLCEESAAESK